MKNKKNIYFLIPAVLLIWGIIGYRIISSVNPSDNKATLKEQTNKFQPKQTIKKDLYVLISNYRDPFLETIIKPKSRAKTFSKHRKERIVFPKIEYKGIFASTNKKNTIYLIEIDNKKEMFKLKEIHHGVKLIQGNVEKITVKFKSQKQSFYLKNK